MNNILENNNHIRSNIKNSNLNNESTLSESGFKREIGLFSGVSIIMGIMIGSGVFYIGSYVLLRTNMTPGLALLSWVIGGIVSLLGGICYAELGASDSRAGGSIVYLSNAYSPIVGFLSGFTSWLIGGPGSIAALAIALPSALTAVIPMGEWTVKFVAVALILGLTAVNYFGVKSGSRVQNLSMIAKLVPIGIIIVLGLLFGKESPNLSLVPTTGNTSLTSIIGMISFAVVASLWAYEGWANLNTVAEEMKNPKKNLPLAIIISIVSITIIYTLFNYAIYKVLPFSTIQAHLSNNEPYLGSIVAESLIGRAGTILVIAGMVVSMFGSLNGCILAFPRMYYAMAKEGHFFNSFKELHPKYKVPHVSLLVQAILSIILVLSRNLDQLTSLVIFTSMLFSTLGILAVIIYRKKFPNLERPYKVIAYPFTVILTALIFIALLANTLFEDPQTTLIGLIIPAIGTLFYFYFDRRNKSI